MMFVITMSRYHTFVVALIVLGFSANSYGLPQNRVRNPSKIIPRNTKDCSIASSGAYIAISSEAEIIEDSQSLRWLEIKWFGLSDSQEDDYIGFWKHEPFSPESPIESVFNYAESGSLRTNERWDGSMLPNKTEQLENYCLPYWVGVVKGGEIVYSSCLKLNANWMDEHEYILESVNLADVVLPGTHDAGASGKFGLAILGDLVGRWTFTQDENLWEQLIMGSRYLDMRIAYYNNTEEKFFVNHDQIRIAPLKGYLNDVAAFMKQTQEIVIFDVQRLPVGFSGFPERYLELIDFLTEHLGKWMTPRSLYPNPTLGEIWESGRRLIVTFPSGYASDHPYLWNQVSHSWPNVNNLDDLKSRLDQGISDNYGRDSLWSANAEFTPSVLDVTLDHWHGLRGAAAITNAPVTQWFRGDWWQMVNIISMDFLPSSGIVEACIEANIAKTSCRDDDMYLSPNGSVRTGGRG